MLEFYKLLNQLTTEKLTEWAQEIVKELKQNHIDAGQVASGDTLKAFGYKIKESNGSIILYIEGAEHIEFNDRGRGPGKQSPVDDIKQWIKDKGLKSKFNIKNDSGLRSVAFAIAKKHGEEGSFQHRNGRTFKGKSKPVSSAFTDAKMNKLNSRLGQAIIPVLKSEILEQFKIVA
jgi:hypothetical protein